MSEKPPKVEVIKPGPPTKQEVIDELADVKEQLEQVQDTAARRGIDIDKVKRNSKAKEKEFKLQKGMLEHRVQELEDLLDMKEQIENLSVKGKQIKEKKAGKSGTESVYVQAISDLHVGQVVKPERVNHLNKYDVDISIDRIEDMFRGMVKMIKKEQQEATINSVLIHLGGDLINGNIHPEIVEENEIGLMEQVELSQRLISSGIEYLQNHLPGIEFNIVCSSGNHARVTKKVQPSNEYAQSLEWLMYENLAKHHPEVNWIIEKGYNTYVDVFGHTFRFHHGHFVKYYGGVMGVGVPMQKAVAGWDKQLKADFSVCGHFHTYKIDPSQYMINGSVVGFDEYAQSIKAGWEPPRQGGFLYNNKWGTTVQIPIIFKDEYAQGNGHRKKFTGGASISQK